MKSQAAFLTAIGAAIFAADQASKQVMEGWLSEGQRVPLIDGFFNLTLTFNKGIAFGGLANLPDGLRVTAISAATLAALGLILYFMLRHYQEDFVARAALAAIIGGAAGNIADRVRLGAVVDFLDVYYRAYHWPAFNLADSAVCLSVAILLLRPAGKKPIPPVS